jgi:uncharacterized membrane protein YjgN (DUF898 family)
MGAEQAAVAADVAAAPTSDNATDALQTLAFEFRATGGEYFRIWIVNLLLTIVTLGIYSAWAKVRRLRYFYGSTSIAGSSFEYHGQPLQILKGRLIAGAAIIVYTLASELYPAALLVIIPVLLLATPWIVVQSRRFQLHMSSWRGIRFAFDGTVRAALKVYVGWMLLAVVTLSMMLPFFLQRNARFLLDNARLGAERFRFTKRPAQFYGFFFITLFFIVLMFMSNALAIYAVFAALPKDAIASSTGGPGIAMMIAMWTMMIVIWTLMIVVSAYWTRSLTNTALDGLEIGPHRLRCRLQTGRLAAIYLTNLLALVLTLGLYWPWAAVRLARYRLEALKVEALGSLDRFAADPSTATSAAGEELGEAFSIDFGF